VLAEVTGLMLQGGSLLGLDFWAWVKTCHPWPTKAEAGPWCQIASMQAERPWCHQAGHHQTHHPSRHLCWSPNRHHPSRHASVTMSLVEEACSVPGQPCDGKGWWTPQAEAEEELGPTGLSLQGRVGQEEQWESLPACSSS